MLETDIQQALVKWAELQSKKHPALNLLFAIPNGTHKSSHASRAKHKREGLKSGVPDLFLSWPSGKYHGYYIEMKAPKKKPSPNQLIWKDKLERAGYKWEYFDDWEKAKDSILEYLKL
jgi:hypothetical protein